MSFDCIDPCVVLAANEKPRKSKTDHSALECKCLVRATDGKRKLATVLTVKELTRFQASYATILKARSRAASLAKEWSDGCPQSNSCCSVRRTD